MSGGYITQDVDKKRRQTLDQLAEEEDRLYSEHQRRLDDIRRQSYSGSKLQQKLAEADANFQHQRAGIRGQMEDSKTGLKRKITKVRTSIYFVFASYPNNCCKL